MGTARWVKRSLNMCSSFIDLIGAFGIKSEDPLNTLVTVIRDEVLDKDKRNPKQKDFILDQLKKSARQISEATYSFDERNTDNAWVETSVYSCHDEYGLIEQ